MDVNDLFPPGIDANEAQQILLNLIKAQQANDSSDTDDDEDEDVGGEAGCFLRAAQSGDVASVEQMLTTNPDLIHVSDPDGYTPLHRAAYNGHAHTLQSLLQHGSKIDARTCDGWQPLHSAAKWNNVDCCRVLLDAGADVNAVTNGGQSALHLASTNKESHALVSLLLAVPGVDVGVRNKAGDTAYDVARRTGDMRTLFETTSPACST